MQAFLLRFQESRASFLSKCVPTQRGSTCSLAPTSDALLAATKTLTEGREQPDQDPGAMIRTALPRSSDRNDVPLRVHHRARISPGDNALSLATQTVTKTPHEQADSDLASALLSGRTQTLTATRAESGDRDARQGQYTALPKWS
jgi:hypothetical protein